MLLPVTNFLVSLMREKAKKLPVISNELMQYGILFL
jgi:hypothetical protein